MFAAGHTFYSFQVSNTGQATPQSNDRNWTKQTSTVLSRHPLELSASTRSLFLAMRVSGTNSICAVILYALTLGYQAHAIELDINNERELYYQLVTP